MGPRCDQSWQNKIVQENYELTIKFFLHCNQKCKLYDWKKIMSFDRKYKSYNLPLSPWIYEQYFNIKSPSLLEGREG